jgi:hypothetical protein
MSTITLDGRRIEIVLEDCFKNNSGYYYVSVRLRPPWRLDRRAGYAAAAA